MSVRSRSAALMSSMSMVRAVPPTNEPIVPEVVRGALIVREEVATFAKVLTPEKYGRFPTTAAVEVESPPKESVAPVSICGQVAVRVSCFALKVDQSAARRQPNTEPEAVSQAKSLVVRVRPSPAVRMSVTSPFVYERPPEKVVVAAAYTAPLALTARPALARVWKVALFEMMR